MDGPLLHLTTAAPWRAALSVGSLAPPSLVTDGFVHLSGVEQVALPAERLFAGRDDILLLVVDPSRLTGEVRWEPGVPSDPAGMRFPHLYGPLPTAAVTSVLPYRPGVSVPACDDVVARALLFDRSLAERRAAAVVPVEGGVAVLDPRVAQSYSHNCLWLSGDVPAPVLLAEADRALSLVGVDHRHAVLDRPPPAGLGWEVQELRILVRPVGSPAEPSVPVVPVTREVMAGLWEPNWRRELPGVGDDVVSQLLLRESIADACVRVVDLAVLGGAGVPVAAAQLRIDGATASIESVVTMPEVRGRGYGDAVMAAALRFAGSAGCDLVLLAAVADDWPRHWYERLGFEDVGTRWEATRP